MAINIEAKLYTVAIDGQKTQEMIVSKEFMLAGYKASLTLAAIVGAEINSLLKDRAMHLECVLDAVLGFRYILIKDFGMSRIELDDVMKAVYSDCHDGRCTI